MQHRMTEFVLGLLFGIGLILAVMTDASKVLGFWDLAGSWDPSLAFVMGGGLLPRSGYGVAGCGPAQGRRVYI